MPDSLDSSEVKKVSDPAYLNNYYWLLPIRQFLAEIYCKILPEKSISFWQNASG